MRKIVALIGVLFILLLGTTACLGQPAPTEKPKTEPTAEIKSTVPTQTVRVEELDVMSCDGPDVEKVKQNGNLDDTIEQVSGADVTANSDCVAIFNLNHGNRTNVLYVKSGWALLNLPVDIFTLWSGDTFLVGSPKKLAADSRLIIDEDTVVVNGGITNYYQNGSLIKKIDWSEVSGGVFVYTLRFESDRLGIPDNERTWTATCDGKSFDNNHLEDAVKCALNGNTGW